jgi:glyoxylase-like metal-dependent hydrolase (beta-lactamase superfamily II)
MITVKCEVFGDLQNNCYLITDEATKQSAIVDCTEPSDKMFDFIGDADLKYVLLTHGHFDHIAGVKAVKEKYGAKAVISNEDKDMMSNGKLSLAVFCGFPQNDTTADICVQDGDVIKLGETDIKVISTPGHTKGGVCYLADDSLFTGDTLFYCSCGRTDFPGGSSQEILQSLNKLAKLDGDYKVYTGHNNQSTLDFERKNNPYMNK